MKNYWLDRIKEREIIATCQTEFLYVANNLHGYIFDISSEYAQDYDGIPSSYVLEIGVFKSIT